jgi:hypothetical protein
VASGFKGGKQIEGVMDQAIAALKIDMAKPKPEPKATPQDKKDLANAQAAHADAQKKQAEIVKLFAELGVPPMMIQQAMAQLAPQYDPVTMPQPVTPQPPAPGGQPMGNPSQQALSPAAGPPGAAGNFAVPPAAPMAPPRPPSVMQQMPNLPGMPQ